MLLEQEDELFSLHVIQSNIDIMRLLAHNLHLMTATLSRTHPPATRMTVLSFNSWRYSARVEKTCCSLGVRTMLSYCLSMRK
jgi:hypothetical protein